MASDSRARLITYLCQAGLSTARANAVLDDYTNSPRCDALARAENLRDKWLAWPKGDTHHSAGLMLAAYLDGTAYGSDEPRPGSDEAHPPCTRWRVELFDGSEWVPGGEPFTDRAEAEAYKHDLSERTPTWADGSPVKRRVVRETTAFTVEQAP